jgi:hypothetical protein
MKRCNPTQKATTITWGQGGALRRHGQFRELPAKRPSNLIFSVADVATMK